MRDKLSKKFPPNLIVLVDTHADNFSGYLQHAGGTTGRQSTTLGNLVKEYVSMDIMNLAAEASKSARLKRDNLTSPRGNVPWCDITATTRGGWRGLALASCGSAILSAHHYEDVRGLITK